MLEVARYFSEEAIVELREQIQSSGGNEVFFVGHVNSEKQVDEVEVYARGNEFETPALLQVASQGDVVIHNHPSGTLRASSADTHVASILGNDGIGFYIIDNDVSKVYAMIEPFQKKDVVAVDLESLGGILAPNGGISQKLDSYEHRPQQIDMMAGVAKSFNENRVALIEAGTGTGKTLAYLLPAITYALNNKERVVISTNTINLQEQLIEKDLPFLQSVLDRKFNAVLVKGRTNYACKRKLLEVSQNPELFSEDAEQSGMDAILQWAKTTKSGSKSDLNLIPAAEVWEKIQSESDTSLKVKCPFYNECFFYNARRGAATADILVANHHLLFSDLALRALRGASENAVLPTYDRIIFDEAHNIEEVATSYFGTGISYIGLQRMLRKLYHRKGAKELGLLAFLSVKITRLARGIPHEKFIKIQRLIQEDGIEKISLVEFLLTETMEQIYAHVRTFFDKNDFSENKLRLVDAVVQTEDWDRVVKKPIQNLLLSLRKFTAKLNDLLQQFEALEAKLPPNLISLTIDLRAHLDRLDNAATGIEHVLLEQDPGHVRWLEVKEGYKGSLIVRLRSAPLEVAPILQETVFKKFKSVILTSATLTVADNFDYLSKRLGISALPLDKVFRLSLPGNFDYQKQVLVAIPTDIPEPGHADFIRASETLILESLVLSGGRAFVLFTSYGLLNMLFRSLKSRIEKLGFNVYKQGAENRHRLLQRFRDDVSSVLFATDSFWEGVDVHGEALESVIIVKLPFRVPSEPIIEARVEAIDRGGGNAFMEYTVPQAVIKFRQGFGRLIRRKSDRGTVLILDKRVVQKRYGRIFLDSLPDCRIMHGATQSVFEELERFSHSDAYVEMPHGF